jgi:hypothetical protein
LLSLLEDTVRHKHVTPAPTAYSSAPKTAKLCADIKYIYDEASWSYKKMMAMKADINKVCNVVKKANPLCVKVRQIQKHTETADLVITPNKKFPYIGPILKAVAPMVKKVREGTKKPAEYCDKIDKSLKLTNLQAKCSKIQAYIKQSEMKLGLIFADVELVDQLWCKCDSGLIPTAKNLVMGSGIRGKMGGHPARSKEVTASCKVIATDAKTNKNRRKCFSLGKWNCPLDPPLARGKNAKHLAEKYPCVRPKVEEWSDKVDQDVARLAEGIRETKKRMKNMLEYLKWPITLEFITAPHFMDPINKFFGIINPLAGFLGKLRSFLDAEIVLKFPGCEEAQTKEELETLLQQRFNMTMKEAMVPVPHLHEHPTMMLLQDTFIKNIKYHQLMPDEVFEPLPPLDAQETAESQLENEMTVQAKTVRGSRRLLSVDKNTPHKPKRLRAQKSDSADTGADENQDASTFVDDTEKGPIDLLDAKGGASQGGKAKWGGRRRRWHGHWPHGHWPHGHWPHPHIPHRHHIHIPHRHHIHIPHRHHIHIPHRHHFHAAAIVKSIGHGIVEGIKKIGDLICYKVRFSVMDILKGVGKFLSWMMKPINSLIGKLLKGLGIKLPGLDLPWPGFNFNVPTFHFNFDTDFLAFNWPLLQFDLKLLAGLSIGELPAIHLPCKSGEQQLSLIQQNPCADVCPSPGCDGPEDASKKECKKCAECHKKNPNSNDELSLVQQKAATRPCDDVCPSPGCDKPEDASKEECKKCAECHQKNDKPKPLVSNTSAPIVKHTHVPVDESAEEGEVTLAPLP